MSHERRGVRQGSGHYAPRRRAHSPAAPGAVFGSPLFRRTAKPKPQPGEQPSRGFGASTQGSVLAEGTEHKHQHPFWAGSSSARGFTAANFSVRISTGSGFCACGGSRTAPRAPIGWIVGSTPRILRQWACGRVASTLSSTRSGRFGPLRVLKIPLLVLMRSGVQPRYLQGAGGQGAR
jgi:hypothetical protein